MSQLLTIHPKNPQNRLVQEAVERLLNGGVIAYPTDSGYALGCRLGDKAALERMRSIRDLDKKHNFTLICRDLSDVGTYAKFDTPVYRLLKSTTPGPYTFILKATKEVPKRILHPKRKTIGLRIPSNLIALALLMALDEPMLSTTLILPGDEFPINDPEEIYFRLERELDLVIDGGFCGIEPTTVVELFDGERRIIRKGKGESTPFL